MGYVELCLVWCSITVCEAEIMGGCDCVDCRATLEVFRLVLNTNTLAYSLLLPGLQPPSISAAMLAAHQQQQLRPSNSSDMKLQRTIQSKIRINPFQDLRDKFLSL